MSQELQNETIAWLETQGFVKSTGTTYALGNIRVSFPVSSFMKRKFYINIRDNVMRTERVETLAHMKRHVEKCMTLRDTYMGEFKTFCLAVQNVLHSRGMDIDIVVGPRAFADFIFHGIKLFSLEVSAEYFGYERGLEIDFWCPEFDAEMEAPEDIINACAFKHKYRQGPMINENKNIVTTEHPQVFMATMLANPCIGIEKTTCIIREVCDVEAMQRLLAFQGHTRKQDLYTIRFANDLILEPVEIREPKRHRAKKEYY